MNPHARSGLWAAVFTGLLFLVFFIPLRPPASWTWATQFISVLILPGMFAAAFLGLSGGTDGAPSMLYVFALTFVICWVLFDLGHTILRKLIRGAVKSS